MQDQGVIAIQHSVAVDIRVRGYRRGGDFLGGRSIIRMLPGGDYANGKFGIGGQINDRVADRLPAQQGDLAFFIPPDFHCTL